MGGGAEEEEGCGTPRSAPRVLEVVSAAGEEEAAPAASFARKRPLHAPLPAPPPRLPPRVAGPSPPSGSPGTPSLPPRPPPGLGRPMASPLPSPVRPSRAHGAPARAPPAPPPPPPPPLIGGDHASPPDPPPPASAPPAAENTSRRPPRNPSERCGRRVGERAGRAPPSGRLRGAPPPRLAPGLGPGRPWTSRSPLLRRRLSSPRASARSPSHAEQVRSLRPALPDPIPIPLTRPLPRGAPALRFPRAPSPPPRRLRSVLAPTASSPGRRWTASGAARRAAGRLV
eukprot:tig00000157_g9697.t1